MRCPKDGDGSKLAMVELESTLVELVVVKDKELVVIIL